MIDAQVPGSTAVVDVAVTAVGELQGRSSNLLPLTDAVVLKSMVRYELKGWHIESARS